MNVVVVIQGREAIPVRAIPLLTNWRFMSPDIVAYVLGGTGGSNVSLFGDMESSHIQAGKVQPINKDWWTQFPVKELRALSEKIQMNESSDDVGYSDWRKQSLKVLPAGVFVWKDEYQKLHDKNWNNRFQLLYSGLRYLGKEGGDNESTEEFEAQILGFSVCKDLLNDDDALKASLWSSLEALKRWREPDYAPFMHSDMYAVVMEGFESQATADMHSIPDGVESDAAQLVISKPQAMAITPSPAAVVAVGASLKHSTKARRDTLTPVIELAQAQCRNPKDAAEVWAVLLVLAEKRQAPLMGATEDGLQYLKDGEARIFKRESLRKRLAR